MKEEEEEEGLKLGISRTKAVFSTFLILKIRLRLYVRRREKDSRREKHLWEGIFATRSCPGVAGIAEQTSCEYITLLREQIRRINEYKWKHSEQTWSYHHLVAAV